MLKKLVATCVLTLTLSNVVYANGGTVVVPPAPQICNIYLGGAFSADLGVFKVNHNVNTYFVNSGLAHNLTNNWTAGLQGVNGEVYGGMGWLFNRFYAGGEIFASITNQQSNRAITTINPFINLPASTFPGSESLATTYKVDYAAGISFIPGFKITRDTMLYGRVGWETGKFEFLETTSSTNNFPFTRFNLPIGAFAFKKVSNGIQLGIGLDAMVMNNCSIRGEYDWNRFGNITHTLSNVDNIFLNGVLIPTNEVANIKYKLVEHQMKLGVSYHFFS